MIVFEFEEKLAALHGDTWEEYEAWFADRDYSVKHIAATDFVALP